ncbi:hypothetical protein [Chitinophaga vietnamensis]|uniref:hypothetical protein n=1 Tax=Chitinophaga vietnamensis TaxID=2593957 RepID=UPI00117869F9|nr:hypothetical protein [Chitinophaga vietnamensis]
MKKIIHLVLAVMLLAACDQKGRHSKYDNEEDTTSSSHTNNTKKKTAAAAPVIGERISGAATLRTAPNGDVLATLADYIPVRCASLQKGWYPVSVDIDITPDEYRKPLFRKGRKLKVNGVVAGELKRDTRLPVATNGEKMWATVNGYTEQTSIRSGTIIENAVASYLKQHKNYSLDAMQPFIRNFKLEEEKVLKPYVLWFNYESGIDDPSPMYRLALVFQGNELIGVIHARPLSIEGTTSRRMQRGFAINFLNGIDKTLRDDFCKKFNSFILSVD